MLFSLVPLFVNKQATFLEHSAVCVINWFTVEAYYLTVTCIVIIPCLMATVFNFFRIYFWRLKYRTGFLKLKAANVEYLLEPTHEMALLLVLVFWCSWLPYVVHLIQYKILGPRTPTFVDIWIGFSQSMWKFPIMVIFCPRYRAYFTSYFHCCAGVFHEPSGTPTLIQRRPSISQRRHHKPLPRLTKVTDIVDFVCKTEVILNSGQKDEVEIYM